MALENEKSPTPANPPQGTQKRTRGYWIAGILGAVFMASFCFVGIIVATWAIASGTAAEEQKQPVPVELTFREAVLGDGLVLILQNTSGKHYTYSVTMRNKGINKVKSETLVISPGGTKEIGWAEGWAFTSGEEIEVKLDGFKTVIQRIP